MTWVNYGLHMLSPPFIGIKPCQSIEMVVNSVIRFTPKWTMLTILRRILLIRSTEYLNIQGYAGTHRAPPTGERNFRCKTSLPFESTWKWLRTEGRPSIPDKNWPSWSKEEPKSLWVFTQIRLTLINHPLCLQLCCDRHILVNCVLEIPTGSTYIGLENGASLNVDHSLFPFPWSKAND